MRINKELLYILYWDKNKSLQKIADIYKCSKYKIWQWTEKYNIRKRKSTHIQNSKINFSQKELEILYGELLGDGCLFINNSSINAYFKHKSKIKKYEIYLHNCLNFLNNRDVKSYKYFDKRTNKWYTSYQITSLTSPTLTKLYNQWYPDGTKHIWPRLKLAPTILLHWYLGDGHLEKRRNGRIILATHSFLGKELKDIVLPQLDKLNFTPKLYKVKIGKNGKQQYSIYIPYKNTIKFLKYIGICPIKSFNYKWRK